MKWILPIIFAFFSFSSFAETAEPSSADEIGLLECSLAKVTAHRYSQVEYFEYKDNCLFSGKQADVVLSTQETIYYLFFFFSGLLLAYRGYKIYENKSTNKKNSIYRVAVLGSLYVATLTPVSITSHETGQEYTISGASYLFEEVILSGARDADNFITGLDREYFDKIITKPKDNFLVENYKSIIYGVMSSYYGGTVISAGSGEIKAFEGDYKYTAEIKIGSDIYKISQPKDLSAITSARTLGIDYAELERDYFAEKLPRMLDNAIAIANHIGDKYQRESNRIPILEGVADVTDFKTMMNHCSSLTNEVIFPMNVDVRSLNKYVTFASYCFSQVDYNEGFSDRDLLVNLSSGVSYVEFSDLEAGVESLCSSGYVFECSGAVKYLSKASADHDQNLGAFNLIYDAFRVLPLQESIKTTLATKISFEKIVDSTNTSLSDKGFSSVSATDSPGINKIELNSIPLSLVAGEYGGNRELRDFQNVGYSVIGNYDLEALPLEKLSIENIKNDIFKGMFKFQERLTLCTQEPGNIIDIRGDIVPCQKVLSEVAFFGAAMGDFGMYLKLGAFMSSPAERVFQKKAVRESMNPLSKIMSKNMMSKIKVGLIMVGMLDVVDVDPFGAGDNSFKYGMQTAMAVSLVSGTSEGSENVLNTVANMLFFINLSTLVMNLYVPFSMFMSLIVLVTMLLTKMITLLLIIRKESSEGLSDVKNSLIELIVLGAFMPTIMIFLYYIVIEVRDDIALFFLDVYEPAFLTAISLGKVIEYLSNFTLFILIMTAITAAFINMIKVNCFKIPSLIVIAKNVTDNNVSSDYNELRIKEIATRKNINKF